MRRQLGEQGHVEYTAKGKAVRSVLGPFYRVRGRGDIYDALTFCRRVWESGVVPVMYGQKGIGKSGVLVPYIEDHEPDTFVIQAGSKRKVGTGVPVHAMAFLSIQGENLGNQIDSQLRTLREQFNLPEYWKYEVGELTLRPSEEGVKEIARAMYGDHPSFTDSGLHSYWWKGTFKKITDILNDSSRGYTLAAGMDELKKLASRSGNFKKRLF